MKSLKRRFNNIAERNPNWSTFTCFSEAICGQGFSGQDTRRWFHRLVARDDYFTREKKEILAHLDSLTKRLRTTRIGGKTAL